MARDIKDSRKLAVDIVRFDLENCLMILKLIKISSNSMR